MRQQHASHLSDIAGTFNAECPDCNGHLRADILAEKLAEVRKAVVWGWRRDYILSIIDGEA